MRCLSGRPENIIVDKRLYMGENVIQIKLFGITKKSSWKEKSKKKQ